MSSAWSATSSCMSAYRPACHAARKARPVEAASAPGCASPPVPSARASAACREGPGASGPTPSTWPPTQPAVATKVTTAAPTATRARLFVLAIPLCPSAPSDDPRGPPPFAATVPGALRLFAGSLPNWSAATPVLPGPVDVHSTHLRSARVVRRRTFRHGGAGPPLTRGREGMTTKTIQGTGARAVALLLGLLALTGAGVAAAGAAAASTSAAHAVQPDVFCFD